MIQKTFGFQAQMAVGDKGEKDFLFHYSKLKPVKSQERSIDFILASGKTVELKSDSYGMERTENFFMETLSGTSEGKLGGVFRAAQDKIDFFVYYYPTDKTFFWFETKKLLKAVENLIATGDYKVKKIRNYTGKGWVTEGYALPRDKFELVLLRMDDFS